jgi:pterin-4a-carbinolamine dehydratase
MKATLVSCIALTVFAGVSALRQDQWNIDWDVNRKEDYIQSHPNEREERLTEDAALRLHHFKLHDDEAVGYYQRHPQFNNEWHSANAGSGWDNSWGVNQKVQYLETHQSEREGRLKEDAGLRARYFQKHNDEAAEYYGHHPEFNSEWHGGNAASGWDNSWGVNQKVQYLETHQSEREGRLKEDADLRARYFQKHNDEAAEYYGHHPEFNNEFRGANANNVWDNNWNTNQKVQYLETHQSEREQRLHEDGDLRARYFQLHTGEANQYYEHHPEHRGEWQRHGQKRQVGRWSR